MNMGQVSIIWFAGPQDKTLLVPSIDNQSHLQYYHLPLRLMTFFTLLDVFAWKIEIVTKTFSSFLP